MAKDPNEKVRATMPSGGEGTVRRSFAVKHGLKVKEGKPVEHRGGRPVPFKPKVSLPSAGDSGASTTPAGGQLTTPGNGDVPPALTS